MIDWLLLGAAAAALFAIVCWALDVNPVHDLWHREHQHRCRRCWDRFIDERRRG